MQYEGLKEYAKEHSIQECAEYYSCNYGAMQAYLYRHKIPIKNKYKSMNGETHTRLWSIWYNMKERCINPNHNRHSSYRDRGITFCSEWNNYFRFKEWALARGYNDSLTLDRIDNNKGYYPSNCRWVTMKTQQNNRRNNHLLTYKGETRTLAQWCEKLNLNYHKVITRINVYHWSVERALETKEGDIN